MNENKTLTHARYVLGGFITLIGVVSVSKYFAFGLTLFISGMLLFPDILEYIEEITKRKIKLFIRILLPFVFFVAAIYFYPRNEGISFEDNRVHISTIIEKTGE